MDLSDESLALWASFVGEVHGIVREALAMLLADRARKGFSAAGEAYLNLELYHRINRCAGERQKALHATVPPPVLSRRHTWSLGAVLEANNQPGVGDDARAAHLNKRPDLQWSFVDDTDDSSVRSYVAECKRLGSPSEAGWEFNVKYVENGVLRFLVRTHLYGKHDIEGAMIGYVQTMDVGAIRGEVNARLASGALPGIPPLLPHPGCDAFHTAGHDLNREEGRSPFRLNHFWIDLR